MKGIERGYIGIPEKKMERTLMACMGLSISHGLGFPGLKMAGPVIVEIHFKLSSSCRVRRGNGLVGCINTLGVAPSCSWS